MATKGTYKCYLRTRHPRGAVLASKQVNECVVSDWRDTVTWPVKGCNIQTRPYPWKLCTPRNRTILFSANGQGVKRLIGDSIRM